MGSERSAEEPDTSEMETRRSPDPSRGTDQIAVAHPAPSLEQVPPVPAEPLTAEPLTAEPGRSTVRAPRFDLSTAAMIALLLVSFFLRVLWLDQPPGSMIFDEKYYVSAARTILDLPQSPDAPYAHSPIGKDPNQEHPPLGKLILAGDIVMLGDNAWGWRWGSVIAGVLAIAFLYQVGRRLRLAGWTAVFAAFLFAFDNLVFVTSRIGILDIFMLVGMIAGIAWFLQGRPVAAGLAFTFGTLGKEYGLYGPAIITLYVIVLTLYQRPAHREIWRRVAQTLTMGVVYLASFTIALWLLDLHWSTFTNPVAHVLNIWSYGTKLTHPAGPTGIESWPWEWLINEVQIPYLKVTVTICKVSLGNGVPCPQDDIIREYASILFRGALNPYLIALLPMALAYAITRLRGGDNRNALLALVWFGLGYLPFLPATVLDRRIAYIYYMLPIVPALALATAELFMDRRIPRLVTWSYVVAILYGFAGYFPFAGFKL